MHTIRRPTVNSHQHAAEYLWASSSLRWPRDIGLWSVQKRLSDVRIHRPRVCAPNLEGVVISLRVQDMSDMRAPIQSAHSADLRGEKLSRWVKDDTFYESHVPVEPPK